MSAIQVATVVLIAVSFVASSISIGFTVTTLVTMRKTRSIRRETAKINEQLR